MDAAAAPRAGQRPRPLAVAVGAGEEELGLVGEGVVPDVVVAQAHLGDGAGGLGPEGGVGQGDPVRLVAGVGAADALVEAAEQAGDEVFAVAATVARTPPIA